MTFEVEKQPKSTNFDQKTPAIIAKIRKKTSGCTRQPCFLSYFRNDPRKELRDTLGDDGQTDGRTPDDNPWQ